MLIGPQNWAANVRKLRTGIAGQAAAHGRSVDSITLLAVSKGHGADSVRAAAAAGVEHFGENYLQEALPKIDTLADLALTWHFIGRLQSNKTRPVAERFDWVHTIDRAQLVERLATQRPYHAPPLNVCIQVSVAGEADKGGAAPAALAPLAEAIMAAPRLRLRGLMCLPPEESDPARQRHWFALAHREFDALRARGLPLDTLSMGMSGDFPAAIAEGATMVRIGTALFGPRPSNR